MHIFPKFFKVALGYVRTSNNKSTSAGLKINKREETLHTVSAAPSFIVQHFDRVGLRQVKKKFTHKFLLRLHAGSLSSPELCLAEILADIKNHLFDFCCFQGETQVQQPLSCSLSSHLQRLNPMTVVSLTKIIISVIADSYHQLPLSGLQPTSRAHARTDSPS